MNARKIALAELPELRGASLFDLGCGPGVESEALVARGAHVLGLDGDERALAAARERVPAARFARLDLLREDPVEVVDGIWCCFTAAYFVDLRAALARWRDYLRPGGWLAVTEIDGLFEHTPLAPRWRALLAAYADDARAAGRYDFACGSHLGEDLQTVGWTVEKDLWLEDRELAFAGPAAPDVLQAWSARFARMPLLAGFAGDDFAGLRDDFLAGLTAPQHRGGRVRFCLARRT